MKSKAAVGQKKKHPIILAISAIIFVLGVLMIIASVSTTKPSSSLNDATQNNTIESLSILRYDSLRELFAGLKETTSPADFTQSIEKRELAYTSEKNSGYTRIKAAYIKSVSVFNYADSGDYLEVCFSNEDSLDYAVYYSKSRKGRAIYYVKGEYPDLPSDTGYFQQQDNGSYTPCSNAQYAIASLFDIDLNDSEDFEKRKEITDWIVHKVESYDSTKIDALSVIPTNDGSDSVYYTVKIDLTWDASVLVSLAQPTTLMYGDDLAATLVLEYQSVRAIDAVWSAPYKDSEVYYSYYRQKEGRMYRDGTQVKPKSRKE